MNTKRTWQFITLAVLIIAVVFIAASPLHAPTHETPAATTTKSGTITLTVAGLYNQKTVSISSGETALAALEALNATDPALGLKTKTYSGLGVLVTSMAGNTNGAGSDYWQYKVNGTMPQVGADQYQLKNGDAVEWFFGPSQE